MRLMVSPSLMALIFPWRCVCSVDQVAGEVARQCRSGLWRRVSNRTINMSIAEMRGYARAQAAGCVSDEVDRVLYRRHLKPTLRSQIVDAAVDQVIGMLVHDFLSTVPPVNANTMAA